MTETVPVSVDAVRDVDGIPMARVTYFVVASEVPEPSWLIGPRVESEFSVQALGLMGVICGPGAAGRSFRDADQIAALFEAVESTTALSIEIEDVWIPHEWLAEDGAPARGDVYRLGLPLFQAAYRFRTEQISREEFVERTPWQGSISFSAEETAAFRAWAEQQLADARSIYPKDADLELAYTEDERT